MSDSPSVAEFKQQLHVVNAARIKALAAAREQPDASRKVELIAELEQVKQQAKTCEAAAQQLELEHGVALCVELFAAVELCQLDLQFEYSKLAETLQDDARRTELFERYAALVGQLNKVARVFNNYGDQSMLERVLETLAVLYMRTSCHDDEIRVLEAAAALGRTPRKVVALMSAYERASAAIFATGRFEVDPSVQQDDPALKTQNDTLLKINYQYWLDYVWLKEQRDFDFDFDAFVKQHKLAAFKALVYVASVLGNPLLVGGDAKSIADAERAANEAVFVAAISGDCELRAIAAARHAESRWNQAPRADKERILRDLQQLEAELRPDTDELRNCIKQLSEQLERMFKCAKCGAGNARFNCSRCHLIKYCSRDCQAAAWPEHKQLCARFVAAKLKAQSGELTQGDRTELLKSIAQITTVNNAS